jgi:hypothetical protein
MEVTDGTNYSHKTVLQRKPPALFSIKVFFKELHENISQSSKQERPL